MWPEDEDVEAKERRKKKEKLPPLVNVRGQDGPKLAAGVTAKLPDLIYAFQLHDQSGMEVEEGDYYFFEIPVSLMTPDDRYIRRLELLVELTLDDGASAPWPPVFLLVSPDNDYVTKVHDIGTIGLDMGAIGQLSSILPVNVKLQLPLQWQTTQPRIRVAGVMRHACAWKVSDEQIANAFVGAAMVGVPPNGQLKVSVRIHVELRWDFFGGIRRGYLWNDADRRTFLLHRGKGMLVGSERTDVAVGGEAFSERGPMRRFLDASAEAMLARRMAGGPSPAGYAAAMEALGEPRMDADEGNGESDAGTGRPKRNR